MIFARSCSACGRRRAECFPIPDLLRRLLLDSVSTFCVLFRHALLLSGAEAGDHKRDVIARSKETFGIDASSVPDAARRSRGEA